MAPVIVIQEQRQVRPEEALPDPCIREDHDDVLLVRRKRGGDLRANKAAPNDGKALSMLRERAETVVIVERAEIDDPVTAPGEPAWRDAGRQQKPVKGKDGSLIVGQPLLPCVQRLYRASKHQLDPLVVEVHPDLVERLALPEPLAEQRPFIGPCDLGAEKADRCI